MNRSIGWLILCVSIAGVTERGAAATTDAFNTCVRSTDVSEKLKACTQAVSEAEKPEEKSAALSYRALVHNMLSRHSEALADIEEALRLTPGHPALLVAKGRILSDSGRHEAALAIFEEVLRSQPDDASTLRSKVQVLTELERHDEALALSAQLVEKHPASYFVWTSRSRALRKAGQHGMALWAAWQAINIDDKRGHAHKLRNDIYMDLGRLEDAKSALRLAKLYHANKASKRFEEAEARLAAAEAAQTEEPGKVPLDQGQQAFADEDYQKALELFLKAAKAGNKTAMGNVAYMYSTGRGTKADSDKAAGWFKKGAEHGSPEAMYNLSTILADGDGVARDPKAASHWKHRSAERGYPPAMRQLGVAYETGEGESKNLHLAAGYYRAAAEQKETTALYRLGRMYEDGRGVPQDSIKAANLVSEAVNQQDAAVLDEMTKNHGKWSKRFWREMQTILHDLKVYNGPADGVAGPDTLQALKALASDN